MRSIAFWDPCTKLRSTRPAFPQPPPSSTRRWGRRGIRWCSEQGDPPGGVQIFYAGFFYRGQRNRELERRYFDVYYPRDERIPRLRGLPDSQLVHCRDLYTDAELKRSPAWNEALPLGHTQNSLNVRLDGPDGTRIVWVVNDPVDTTATATPGLVFRRRNLSKSGCRSTPAHGVAFARRTPSVGLAQAPCEPGAPASRLCQSISAPAH